MGVFVLGIKKIKLSHLMFRSGWDRWRKSQIASSTSCLGHVGQKMIFFLRLSIVIYYLFNEHVCAKIMEA